MIGIIDYKTGNLRSVQNALARLGAEYIVSSDAERLSACERIILPGVGDAAWAMHNLRELGLVQAIRSFTQPVLGICLGMQLLCSHSEENDTPCLGIFENRVFRFPSSPASLPETDGASAANLKVPHTGWNTVTELKSSLFAGIEEGTYMYFVHSYYAEVNENTAAVTRYGVPLSATLRKNNFMGCQFHPEKSGPAGEKILLNFLSGQPDIQSAEPLPAQRIEIIPAIDLLDGKCVRLRQGRYDDCKIYSDDPLEIAQSFEQAGTRRLHVVDLDGAKAQAPRNTDILYKIVRNTGLKVEYGGGIKTPEALKEVLDKGADRVICGSIAVRQPALFIRWLEEYGPEKIVLGADIRNDYVAVGGWIENTELTAEALLEKFIGSGLKYVIITDISRDGTMLGPSCSLYRELADRFPGLEIIASGGIGKKEDFSALESSGVKAVIVGKALYEGTVSLKDLARLNGK